jgi:hypothetical protein
VAFSALEPTRPVEIAQNQARHSIDPNTRPEPVAIISSSELDASKSDESEEVYYESSDVAMLEPAVHVLELENAIFEARRLRPERTCVQSAAYRARFRSALRFHRAVSSSAPGDGAWTDRCRGIGHHGLSSPDLEEVVGQVYTTLDGQAVRSASRCPSGAPHRGQSHHGGYEAFDVGYVAHTSPATSRKIPDGPKIKAIASTDGKISSI